MKDTILLTDEDLTFLKNFYKDQIITILNNIYNQLYLCDYEELINIKQTLKIAESLIPKIIKSETIRKEDEK